jgi:DNA replication protein DnaC
MYNLNEVNPLKRFWLTKNSNIPIRFQGWDRESVINDLGSFPVEIDEWVSDMVAGKVILAAGGLGVTGVGLLFDGAPGMGKTTHAVVAANQFVLNLPDDKEQLEAVLHTKEGELGHKLQVIKYTTFPEFLALKKSVFDADADEKRRVNLVLEGYHGRSAEDWLNVRLLIIDDLGKERGTNYEDSSFDELLRSRYDKGLPTIVTTNVNRENWKDQYGDAMGSFVYEAFHQVKITSKDLRS